MSREGKTEKATPKRRREAREKGQVAKSADLNGAVVVCAGLAAMGIAGPMIAAQMSNFMTHTLGAPDVGLKDAIQNAGLTFARCLIPIAASCFFAALLINVAQVGLKPTPKALFDPKRLNPLKGAKNLFGARGAIDTLKAILKLSVIGAIIVLGLVPKFEQLAGTTGMSPAALAQSVGVDLRGVLWRAAGAYLVLSLVDYGLQKYRFERDLRMDKQEIKQEFKQEQVAAEVKSAQRRRAAQAARARMMAAVPGADVVVTNPTHYAVALKYAPGKHAPEVVAKGVDHVAARIRELAAESGVPVLPDPPLARALHASVEIGQAIPEELFQAVARVLAFVYRMAARR